MKRVLYLGTDPSFFRQEGISLIHYPLLEVIELPFPKVDLDQYSHFVFTSKHAVSIFFKKFGKEMPLHAYLIAVGKVTAFHLSQEGFEPNRTASIESQEGIISLISTLERKASDHYLLPRSQLARPLLTEYLTAQNIAHTVLDLYTVKLIENLPPVDWSQIDAIFFTSPSTVKAFLDHFGFFPEGKELLTIGSVTQQFLESKSSNLVL